MVIFMKFDYGLGHATRKFFCLESWHTCSIPHLILLEGIATSNPTCTLRTFCPNPIPQATTCQKGHEMNGLGLGVLSRIFFVLGSHDREYWIWLGDKPLKIPLDNGLGHLANLVNVMSYILHCFVLGPW
jgi:hypothetical protein